MKSVFYFSFWSVLAVYFLIFVGSLVRASGSGMGCPDWPKCYGKWVPPTSEFEPSDDWYSQVFEERRLKNSKLIDYLEFLGDSETADRIANSDVSYTREPINIQKTWIEYLNRLVGVLVGLVLFALLIASMLTIKTNLIVFLLSFAVFLITGFQGWLGSLVVTTSLIPQMVSIHMVLAMVIVVLLLLIFSKTLPSKRFFSSSVRLIVPFLFVFGFLILVFIQIKMGLSVRESVDDLFHEGVARSLVLDRLGNSFEWHRSLSWLILVFSGALYFILKKNFLFFGAYRKMYTVLLLAVIGEFIVAILFQYSSFPAFAQPFHLLFAGLLMGMLFLYLFLFLRITALARIQKPT